MRTLRQRLAFRSDTGPLLAYFGHHKCGTQWIKDMMRDISLRLGLKEETIPEGRDPADLARHVAVEQIRFLSLINASMGMVLALRDFRAFHVVRDPRDIIVSAYFSHRNSHPMGPWLEQHRATLQALGADEGLYHELQFSAFTMHQLREWNYQMPHVLEVRFEDFVAAPTAVLRRIMAFLGLPLFKFEVRAVADRHSFARQTHGRQAGHEDPHHHFRKGQPGDWTNHFKDEHKRYFKKHYQDVLELLGYENNSSW